MTWRAIDALSATAIAEAKAADARTARPQVARPARRRAGVRQSDLRHERAADHRVERGVGAALPGTGAARCDRGGAAARGRRDRARQDGGRRLRLSRRRHEQPHRPGAQPVRSDRHAHARRIQRRIGGRGRRRHGVRRARHRRRRIEPDSGRLHRRRRDEADVRARAAHRRHPDVAVSRHARSARALGRGRGAAARRDCRRRCVGSALALGRALDGTAARRASRRRAERRAPRPRRGARAARRR